MKRNFLVIATLVVMVLSISGFAQTKLVAPASTLGTVPGVEARTNLLVVQPDSIIPDNNYPGNAETAGSIACIYGVSTPVNGCPKNGSNLATGGAKAIAVVDYGHTSTLQSDFDTLTPT